MPKRKNFVKIVLTIFAGILISAPIIYALLYLLSPIFSPYSTPLGLAIIYLALAPLIVFLVAILYVVWKFVIKEIRED